MEYRAGKCSQCGAEYQIPASFAHNVARCKKCKVGVVHVSAPAKGAGGAAGSAPVQVRPAPTQPDPAREAAIPASAPDRRGEAVSTRARTPSARSPEPAGVPQGKAHEQHEAPAHEARANQPERSRTSRAAIVGVGLLLIAALACVWFLYLRNSG